MLIATNIYCFWWINIVKWSLRNIIAAHSCLKDNIIFIYITIIFIYVLIFSILFVLYKIYNYLFKMYIWI